MPRIKTYKNSKLASTFSFLGYIVIAGGIYAIANDEPLGGVIALVIGIALKFLASFISKKKHEKDAKFNQSLNS